MTATGAFSSAVEKYVQQVKWENHLSTNEWLFGHAYGPWRFESPVLAPKGIRCTIVTKGDQ